MMCDTYKKQKGRENADRDGRHGEMASGGWQYRSAYFMDFDGSYYLVTISAAKSNEGLVVYNIGQMKKEAFPKIKGSSATSDNGPRGNASNNSISTSGEKVNGKFSLKGMDRDYSYSALVRKPDMRLTQIAETSPGNRADIIRETKPVRGSPVSRTGGHNRCVSQEEFSTVPEGSQAVQRKQQYRLRKVHTYDLQKLVLFTIIVHSNREMTTLS